MLLDNHAQPSLVDQTKSYQYFDHLFERVQKNRDQLKLGTDSPEELRKFDHIVANFFTREFHLHNDGVMRSQRETLSKLKTKHDLICERIETNCLKVPSSPSIISNGESSSKVEPNHGLGSGKRSIKKLVCSRKQPIVDQQIRFDLQELYVDLIHLEQTMQLEASNFERILRKHDRKFNSNLGRKFYQRCSPQRPDELYHCFETIELLIESTEAIHWSCLTERDAKKALRMLRNSSKEMDSGGFDLRLGFELGSLLMLLILLVLVATGYSFATNDNGATHLPDWPTTIRLYRAPLVLSLFLFQAGLSVAIWRHYNINYEQIFQLHENGLNLPYRHLVEHGSLLGIFSCLALMLWLVDSPKLWFNPRHLSPLAAILVVFGYLFNPTSGCHRRERVWLIKVLGRILTAPFYSVQFADYWIADQFVSMVPLFLDLEYVSCHYAATATVSNDTMDTVVRCVSRNHPHLLIRSIVAVAPAWLRLCQCLRIARDEHWRPHQLFNALKYGSMIYVITLSQVADAGNAEESLEAGAKVAWLMSAGLVSCVAAGWDMIYDFGVLESLYSVESNSNERKGTQQNGPTKRWPLLRRQLTYPVWFYYFAIIEDWILKFGWLIFIVMTRVFLIETEFALTITTITDLFSKFIWNVIKVENEWRLRVARQRATRSEYGELSFIQSSA